MRSDGPRLRRGIRARRGQSIGDVSKDSRSRRASPRCAHFPDGFPGLRAKGVEEDFAQDLSAAEKALLVALQLRRPARSSRPTVGGGMATKKSFYVVASNDRMMRRAGAEYGEGHRAKTITVPSSTARCCLTHRRSKCDRRGRAYARVSVNFRVRASAGP